MQALVAGKPNIAITAAAGRMIAVILIPCRLWHMESRKSSENRLRAVPPRSKIKNLRKLLTS
jgi:hypothetical protein